MWSGVGKSGSPAPKPITGSPASLKTLALLVTAIVADSDIEAILCDIRFFVIVLFSYVRKHESRAYAMQQ